MQEIKTLNVLSELIREGFSKRYDPAEVDEALRAAWKIVKQSLWQPIETAPRDETWVLLWGKDEETPLTAQWRGNNWLTPDGIVWSEEELYAPTHWMPLPEPPNA